MIDRHSETWRTVYAWASEALAAATSRIEKLGVDAAETENLRGTIATLREVITMADDPEPTVVEQPDDYGFQGADPAA